MNWMASSPCCAESAAIILVECGVLSSYNARRPFQDVVRVAQQGFRGQVAGAARKHSTGTKNLRAGTKHLRDGTRYLRATLIQLTATGCAGLVAYLFLGTPATVSLVSGALCAVVPQAYFALRMSRASAQSAQRAARLGLAAEGGKFLLSVAAFALVFAVLKPAQPGLVFLGYGVLWVVQIIEGVRLLNTTVKGPDPSDT